VKLVVVDHALVRVRVTELRDRGTSTARFRAVVDELLRAKPAASKGRYVRSVAVSSTMGPGVRIDPNRIRVIDEDMAPAS